MEDIQKNMLNIRIINFLQQLGEYNKLKILCKKDLCGATCRSVRSHQVIGISEKGEENLLMTASQEEMKCDSFGYMLVYRSNGVIFGALGYQVNPINDCCNCGSCNFCSGFCTGCCESQRTACCTCCSSEVAAQKRDVVVFVTMAFVLGGFALFAIVAVLKEDVAENLVVKMAVFPVRIVPRFY